MEMTCVPSFIMSTRQWPKKPSPLEGSGSLPQTTTHLDSVVTRVMIRTGQVTSVVELRITCAEHVVRDGATRTVAGPARLRVAAVGRLQNGERQRVVVDASLTAGTTEANDGLGAVGVLEVTDLLANRVHCLVPSGALPLVLAAVLGSRFIG